MWQVDNLIGMYLTSFTPFAVHTFKTSFLTSLTEVLCLLHQHFKSATEQSAMGKTKFAKDCIIHAHSLQAIKQDLFLYRHHKTHTQ